MAPRKRKAEPATEQASKFKKTVDDSASEFLEKASVCTDRISGWGNKNWSSMTPDEKWSGGKMAKIPSESKHVHEQHQYCSDRDDFDVDRQLSVRAIDRHQNYREQSHIDSIYGRVLVCK